MSELPAKRFNKLMAANRGEIAIRIFRAATELNIRTVALYTHEDRYSLHRYKADEAYQLGADNEPLMPYLDIEAIIALALKNGVDAIHPGYGFLSENVQFAKRCKEEGITFIGPEPEVMQQLGDKVSAKEIAKRAQVPVIEDSKEPLLDGVTALSQAKSVGFPVMLKAAAGGGGRGMRVVRDESSLIKSFNEARSEAAKAFGNDTIFLEKFIDSPKHIEVQLMGDNFGNIVHLYERDCSVQRRFQKVVEVAPSPSLPQETREQIFKYALAIAREVNYNNVGTVEFLVDPDHNIYFIEVNPRIQVEHTITEEVTGIDIVRTQILLAANHPLNHRGILIESQDDIKCEGFAIQCRITTEDPENNFKPDYGTIIAYRNAGGFGIRLDEGSCYPGAKILPFFDSMLVKVSSTGRTLRGAIQRCVRSLKEFRIRGVKTNIGFLENVITHPIFNDGKATVNFIGAHPELFDIRRKQDRGTKTLRYLADVIVNGNPDVKQKDDNKVFLSPKIPPHEPFAPYPKGTKDLLTELGPKGFAQWLKAEKQIHYTDTTFRDAHQSLLATRMRSIDLLAVAESFAKHHPNVFSMEVWGGATFDVCLRFLHECPWDRLDRIREAVPNILLQMLLRGSNAVGYTAYPDNLVEKFIVEAAAKGKGIDVFRIFDSLNWIEAMKLSIRTVVNETDSLAEVCIGYTGDILAGDNQKYNLQYYLDLARKIEDEGAHVLCIKDMAGLLKPYSAEILVKELNKAIDLPIHLHTHDTSGAQIATYLKAVEAGVDVVDVALGAMSGLTSQPNFNTFLAMVEPHERAQKFDQHSLNAFSNYWETVREVYYPFESGLKASTAEVYDHEIPGGQYSNLRPQARGLGLEERFEEIKSNYAAVNELFGNIVKVTPSSKVVGDMALFMTSNNLTPADILEKGDTINFPDSVINFFRGDLGQPYQGFPAALQKIVLKDEKAYTERPNAHLEPVDFDKEFTEFQIEFDQYTTFRDFLSYKLYPKVFTDYREHYLKYGNVQHIPSPAFFYGLKNNEELLVEIAPGKKIILRFLYASAPDEEGYRKVSFELNGQTRIIRVKDQQVQSTLKVNKKASEEFHIGAPLQGQLSGILVKEGEVVTAGQPLFLIEAMKMSNTITAPFAGKVKKIWLEPGIMVVQDDMVIEMLPTEA